MKFIDILLKEGRKEDLKKKYSNKFKEEDLDFVLGIADLQDFNHKYTDWVLKNVDPEPDFDMTVDTAVWLIKQFDKYQKSLEKKDINQYKSLHELDQALQPFKLKEKEKELESQADKIYEDDTFVVVKPKTEEASCKYGSNTKWCVTSPGSDHFRRYTSGRQGLYFIINKAKSTNKNYSKIAIHFDNGGNTKYWDSQDHQMSPREEDIINYAFSEVIEAIKKDYKEFAGSLTDKFLAETFDTTCENSAEQQRYLNSPYTLSVLVRGFQNISDSDFGKSEAELTVSLLGDDTGKKIDGYHVFINYQSQTDSTFTASIGFMGMDATSEYIDLGLEGWGIDVTYKLMDTPVITANGVGRHIATRVLDHIKSNPELLKRVAGSSTVWRPDRFNYGYTFAKNKGLIQKLVNYLDKGTIGTKLDFLESIGKLKSKIVDGKKQYSHSTRNNFFPASSFRGQFSSFFASAKLAGILSYRKIGKDYFLTKGPNFEAFKEGKLKAL